jgi:hypothetical protein
MSHPQDPEPTVSDVLVAVFAPEQVDLVRRELERQGCPADAVHVGDEADERWSLRAEQTEETDRSLMAPHAGAILPKEAAKAVSLAIPMGAAIGALVILPFALIDIGGLSIWLRLFWAAVVGATLGGTVGYLVGAAMASKDPLEPGAAQRGTVVRVDGATPAVAAALAELAPIRIDRFGPDGVVRDVVATEEDRQPGGIAEEVAANVQREVDADPADRTR